MLFNLKKFKETIDNLDPDRIYVENIRSILGTNTRIANLICSIAVKKGFFEKFYGFTCKNENCGRIIVSYSSLEKIPKTITCSLCQDEGVIQNEFETINLDKIIYFKYVKNSFNVIQTDLVS